VSQTTILVLSVLAVYRISHMLTREDGPFDIFIGFRHRIGQHNWIGRGMNCVLCVSFWLSALTGFVPGWLLLWFGIAGAVTFIHKVSDFNYGAS